MLFAMLFIGLFMLGLGVSYSVFMFILFIVYKVDGGKMNLKTWWKKMEG